MDQRRDSCGSSYTLNCNLESAAPTIGSMPKLLSDMDSPCPCALMYASFAVQQLKNDGICSDAGCDRNHSTSGREKKRSANSNAFVSCRILSTSTPTCRCRVTAKTVTPCVCDRLKRRSLAGESCRCGSAFPGSS